MIKNIAYILYKTGFWREYLFYRDSNEQGYGEICLMNILIILLLENNSYSYQIIVDEMNGLYS
jgi:hypothetical protein